MNAPPISMNPISMSFGNPPNSQSNNTSPFASFENAGEIFGNNHNGNSNQNQDKDNNV